MKIHTATIFHKYGTNSYVAKTEAGLYRKLADYCREWWGEAFPNSDPDKDPSVGDDVSLTDKQIVEAYFDVMNDRGEYYDRSEDTLDD